MTEQPQAPLWAWRVLEANGEWGMITGVIPTLGLIPLVARSEHVARHMQPFAELHRSRSGRPICLVRFDPTSILVHLPAPEVPKA
jgi:hypothetical protein